MNQMTQGLLLLYPLSFCLISTAYADSSWIWISESRPYDILPFVIVGTLLVEAVGIGLAAKVKKSLKVFSVVCLGNLISFGAANLLLLSDEIYTFKEKLDHLPIYITSVLFIVLTLVFEIPVEYALLKKDTAHKKRLLFSIILFNAITTIAVAVVERTLYHGYWV